MASMYNAEDNLPKTKDLTSPLARRKDGSADLAKG
jgi:hypothetical protein